jgi:hypothetical protein
MDRWTVVSLERSARAPRGGWAVSWGAVVLCLGLVACGGNPGGTNAAGTAGGALGLVKVTVKDAFGAAVVGAALLGPTQSTSTDAKGVALVTTGSPNGSVTLAVSRDNFVSQSVQAVSVSGQLNELQVTLERVVAPAGGSLASRSGTLAVVDASGQQLSFEIELIVVDGQSQPIENLAPANFMLRACAPTAAMAQADCVSGASVGVAYGPASAAPQSLALIAGGAVTPYAAALLLDQSGSIAQSDPTGARLFSSKAFLSGLGAQDQAMVAAFAAGPGARIASPPLTVYASFKDLAAAPADFAVLDSLAVLTGGQSPLYDSLDALQRQLAADTALPASLSKAVVIFTDGADTNCLDAADCQARRDESIRSARAGQVRLFTIGLSSSVDIAALGELANQTGGALLYADSAAQLLPLYGTVGRLLSLSLPTYRLRWTVQAAAAGAFQSGDSLLGRVQVSVGTQPFDVPFVVGIP